ncbi:MAG: L,D-transpeptidase [Verrucomicrobiota bacterium]|nr:L,D-transpeptidase [Verrucomicrobiota bacterium]
MQQKRLHIDISIPQQELKLRTGRKIIRRYPISTSRFGTGAGPGSFRTPLGEFRVSDKIGAGASADTIFVGRSPLKSGDPLPATDDLIMARILWLDGLEAANANTRDRYIYIHGTRHEDKIGAPASHGCIRMRNADVIELFDLVPENTTVTITA